MWNIYFPTVIIEEYSDRITIKELYLFWAVCFTYLKLHCLIRITVAAETELALEGVRCGGGRGAKFGRR